MYQSLHAMWSDRTLDAIAIAAAIYGVYGCLLLAGLAVIRARAWRWAWPLFVGAFVAVALDLVAGILYADVRPFVALHVAPLVPHDADNGFPSDHSVVAAFAALVAWRCDRRLGIAAWIVAIAIGTARVFCLLHRPEDVIAGWLIGAFPAAIALSWMRSSR